MGSANPLKNEVILLVVLQTRLHKVEDTGIAEMSFVFLGGLFLLRNIAHSTFIGKNFQLKLWILKRLE